MNRSRRLSRRLVLRGLGGAALALPFLEGLAPREARSAAKSSARSQKAREPLVGMPEYLPFAIFFRQANGVACEQNTSEIGMEPERFWPTAVGPLTPETMAADRATSELLDHRDKLLLVRNVNMQPFPYNDGHAGGALQTLTAQGPTVPNAGGDSEAAGESIDHRIGRELNEEGRDSLFLYAGQPGGWLGGPCISYRGPANRRSALNSPWNAYQTVVSGTGGMTPEMLAEIAARRKSVNDLVRVQMDRLLLNPRLSTRDRQRLELHRQAIRDLEITMTCRMSTDAEKALEGASTGFDSTDGDEVLKTARLHMDIAVLAVACGYTRSVSIQMGNGNDGQTRFHDPDTGDLMENYHYISHRRLSHDSEGDVIPNSDVLHHKIDRQFAQAFKYLLDKLAAYDAGGRPLLDVGVAVWHNDNGNGPAHSIRNCPWILAGSADGYLKQGQYVAAEGGNMPNHSKMLNTIGSAVGVKNGSGDPLDDFGDPASPKGVMTELLA